MAMLSDLFGRKKGGPTARRDIADVEAAISRLVDERRVAREAIADTLRRREEMLLQDGSDAKIVELDASTDLIRIKLERFDKAEPLLIQELQALRGEKRRDTWRDIASRHNRAALQLAAKMRDALEHRDALTAIVAEAQNGGFAAEAAQFAFSPPILDLHLLTEFERSIDRARDGAERAAKPSPAISAPPAVAKSKAPAAPPQAVGAKGSAAPSPSPRQQSRRSASLLRQRPTPMGRSKSCSSSPASKPTASDARRSATPSPCLPTRLTTPFGRASPTLKERSDSAAFEPSHRLRDRKRVAGHRFH